jgi:CDP-diglyceride synthetase
MERRVGSSHVSRKTVLGMIGGAIAGFAIAEVNTHGAGAGVSATGAPPLAWAACGASSGMVVAVFAQFGTDESRWESIWSQYGN